VHQLKGMGTAWSFSLMSGSHVSMVKIGPRLEPIPWSIYLYRWTGEPSPFIRK